MPQQVRSAWADRCWYRRESIGWLKGSKALRKADDWNADAIYSADECRICWSVISYGNKWKSEDKLHLLCLLYNFKFELWIIPVIIRQSFLSLSCFYLSMFISRSLLLWTWKCWSWNFWRQGFDSQNSWLQSLTDMAVPRVSGTCLWSLLEEVLFKKFSFQSTGESLDKVLLTE